MKRPNFQEKTEVKVISHDFTECVRVKGVETKIDMYGWRGVVTAITGLDKIGCMVLEPYSPGNYPVKWWVYVTLKSPVDGREYPTIFDDWESQLEVNIA